MRVIWVVAMLVFLMAPTSMSIAFTEEVSEYRLRVRVLDNDGRSFPYNHLLNLTDIRVNVYHNLTGSIVQELAVDPEGYAEFVLKPGLYTVKVDPIPVERTILLTGDLNLTIVCEGYYGVLVTAISPEGNPMGGLLGLYERDGWTRFSLEKGGKLLVGETGERGTLSVFWLDRLLARVIILFDRSHTSTITVPVHNVTFSLVGSNGRRAVNALAVVYDEKGPLVTAYTDERGYGSLMLAEGDYTIRMATEYYALTVKRSANVTFVSEKPIYSLTIRAIDPGGREIDCLAIVYDEATGKIVGADFTLEYGSSRYGQIAIPLGSYGLDMVHLRRSVGSASIDLNGDLSITIECRLYGLLVKAVDSEGAVPGVRVETRLELMSLGERPSYKREVMPSLRPGMVYIVVGGRYSTDLSGTAFLDYLPYNQTVQLNITYGGETVSLNVTILGDTIVLFNVDTRAVSVIYNASLAEPVKIVGIWPVVGGYFTGTVQVVKPSDSVLYMLGWMAKTKEKAEEFLEKAKYRLYLDGVEIGVNVSAVRPYFPPRRFPWEDPGDKYCYTVWLISLTPPLEEGLHELRMEIAFKEDYSDGWINYQGESTRSFTSIVMAFHDVPRELVNLHRELDMLRKEHERVLDKLKELTEKYNMLSDDYESLSSKYEANVRELNTFRSLTTIFAMTTVAFAAIIVYFARRNLRRERRNIEAKDEE